MLAALLKRTALGIAAVLTITPALAAPHRSPAGAINRAACVRMSRLATTDSKVISARPVAAGVFEVPANTFGPNMARRLASMPAFCRIVAVASPTADSRINVEIWLPLKRWNGRFLGTGNGGAAGSIGYGMGMIEGLKRGFAVANTDLGTAPDIDTVIDHPTRREDFGFRATHEMTRIGKEAVRAFYDVASFRSYFAGCSTGGQQALREAQRFPDDYDGILAGDPGNNRTHSATYFLWNFDALNATPASNLSSANWSVVTNAVLGACGGKDGGAPGDHFLTDPQRCHFKPDTILRCAPGTAMDNCLTAPQAAALLKLYAGPVNPHTGERIYAGLPVGSESSALGPLMQGDPKLWPKQQFYLFRWVLGAGFIAAAFDFDHDLDRVDAALASPLNANEADLSAFARHGGKLILYSGLSDPAVPYEEVINYYERIAASRGGELAAVRAFARLMLVPGMGHCIGFGVPAPTEFGQPYSPAMPRSADNDLLMALVAWTEKGRAPDGLRAVNASGDGSRPASEYDRPLCSYPELPEYRGGDPNKLMSFRCVAHGRHVLQAPAARYLN